MYIYQTLLTQELSAAEVLGGAALGGLKASRMSARMIISIHPVQQLQLVSKFSWSKQIVKWLPNSHESSPQILLCLQLSLVPSLLSPWRLQFPLGIILTKLYPQLWSSFSYWSRGGLFISLSYLSFQQLLETGHRRGAAESCTNSKEAGGNPNLSVLHEPEWPFPRFIYTHI